LEQKERIVMGSLQDALGIFGTIAVTAVIVAVMAPFAYGLIGGVTTSPRAALVVEDATAGKTNITVIHHGGETISSAFRDGEENGWEALEVKVNGQTVEIKENGGIGEGIALNGVWVNNYTDKWVTTWGSKTQFAPGDELEIGLKKALESGDTVTIVYTPRGDILQRVKVA